jgi:hypothetical protein
LNIQIWIQIVWFWNSHILFCRRKNGKKKRLILTSMSNEWSHSSIVLLKLIETLMILKTSKKILNIDKKHSFCFLLGKFGNQEFIFRLIDINELVLHKLRLVLFQRFCKLFLHQENKLARVAFLSYLSNCNMGIIHGY